MKYRVVLWTNNWAGYVNRDIESQVSFIEKALEYWLNRLTPLYSKIYYEEENYLKVRTKLFIYLSPPYSKGLGMWEHWYVSMSRFYILAYLYTEFCYVTRLPLIL